jgi:hypothetical protein
MTNLRIIEHHEQGHKNRAVREIRDDAAFVTFKWLGRSFLAQEAMDDAPTILAPHITKNHRGDITLNVDGHIKAPLAIDIRTEQGKCDLVALIKWLDKHLATYRTTFGNLKHWRETEYAVFNDYTVAEARKLSQREALWTTLDVRVQEDSVESMRN